MELSMRTGAAWATMSPSIRSDLFSEATDLTQADFSAECAFIRFGEQCRITHAGTLSSDIPFNGPCFVTEIGVAEHEFLNLSRCSLRELFNKTPDARNFI
jgi:hypothetical protein